MVIQFSEKIHKAKKKKKWYTTYKVPISLPSFPLLLPQVLFI